MSSATVEPTTPPATATAVATAPVMDRESKEIYDEYLSSLGDLNMNSKPLINMLTILADENIGRAAVIVQAVNHHIAKVAPDVKLPILYLIDSIVKNVGREYKLLFSQCIVSLFCGVFDVVNEKTREKMYNLRMTWNEVFSQNKLYALDVKVNCIDPNWPITAKVVPTNRSPAIHVNPNFFNRSTAGVSDMQQQLRDKERELLELQKKKLELELAATKKRIEEQEKQLNLQTESVKPTGGAEVSKSVTGRTVLPSHTTASPMMSSVVTKPVKINPVVNPALVSSLSSRDPRLMRQQQQQRDQQNQQRRPLGNEVIMRPNMQPRQMPGIRPQQRPQQLNQPAIIRPHINPSRFPLGTTLSIMPPDRQTIQKLDKIPRLSSRSAGNATTGNEEMTSVEKKSGNRDKSRVSSKSKNSSSSRNSKSKSNDTSSESRKSDKYHDSSKKKTSSGSPSSRSKSTSDTTPSPKKATVDDTTTTTDTMPTSGDQSTKFKDIKSPKSRNYSRRNRNPSPETLATRDVDLRTLMPAVPEKKARLDAIIDDRIKDLNNASGDDMNEQKTIIEASAKDIDLRLLPSNTIETVKKRSSSDKSDEPSAKKSKSEKLDVLFGSEDVDLRTLNSGAANDILTVPPPPMISQTESVSSSKPTATATKSLKSHFEEVRAKLAKATKAKKDKLGRPLLYIKLPDDPIERKRRISTPSKISPSKIEKSAPKDEDENSQESYTTNMKTIIAQAQEQLDNKEIDHGQYETLVKQVLQINEKRQIVEMQRKMQLTDEEMGASSGNEERGKNNGDGGSDRTRQQDFDGRNKAQDRTRQKDPRRAGPWATNKPWDRNPSPPQNPLQAKNPWPSIGTANVFDQTAFNRNTMHQTTAPKSLDAVLRSAVVPAPLTETKSTDIMRSINIDGVPREIRFYEETAIIVMDFQDLREIGFQMGQRRVTVDDTTSIVLSFNDIYKSITIEGKIYQIRFGAPTRELYIDGHFYECYFGPTTAPLQVMLADGKMHKFDIEGPPPQVKIGNRRTDLVVGMCNMVVDAKILIPLFLDGTQQVFEIDGKQNVLQFADFLLTVLLNNEPHSIEFGGFPKSIRIQNQKHFIRFTALPKGIVAGKIFIKHMRRTDRQRNLQTPPLDTTIVPLISAPVVPHMDTGGQDLTSIAPMMNELTSSIGVVAPATIPFIATDPVPFIGPQLPTNYQMTPEPEVVDPLAVGTTPAAAAVTNVPTIPGLNNLNIEELYQKLLTSGILGKTIKADESSEEKKELERKRSKDKDRIMPVRLSKPESIKKRQSGIVIQLFSGMQCSSCGVRFPPEQTMRYSQHLDWHFRQNRRDRDSARRAHSRKWYYDVSDWIQYEEIEDLEEREKNWFETQQNEAMDVLAGDDSNQRGGGAGGDSPIPSCSAGPDGIDQKCQMCHDAFEHFYNEETEEWHLKSALNVDDVFYHPLCYEDYKASLTMDESAMSASLTSTNNDDDEVIEVIGDAVKKEKSEPSEATNMENTAMDEDDDDVIALPAEDPIVTEILDDDDEKMGDGEAEVETGKNEETKPEETEAPVQDKEEEEKGEEVQPDTDPDVMIKEPIIETHDLDEYVPKSLSSTDLSQSTYQAGAIKIKEEPKDDGYEDDGFEDVGTVESSFVLEKDTDEEVADDESQPAIEVESLDSPAAPASHSGLVSAIDGNVDIQDVAGPIITSHKIRINITKSKQTLPSTTNINSNLGNNSDNTSILDNLITSQASALVTTGANGAVTTTTTTASSNVSDNVNDTNDVNIDYELKESLKHIDFKKIEPKRSGYETSGLCSIM